MRLMSDVAGLPWPHERIYEISIDGGTRKATISHSYTHGWSTTDPDQADDPCTFTVELEAIDARDARIRTQHILATVSQGAGLPVEAAPVVWVAPAAGTTESSRRFRSVASDLMDAERFDAAVAMAQVHLEVQVRVIVEMLVSEDRSALAGAVARRETNWSLARPWHREVLGALLGVEVTTFPHWHEYTAHVKRRNAVLHRGLVVDEEEARASLEVVDAFWLWLNSAFEQVATSRRYPYG